MHRFVSKKILTLLLISFLTFNGCVPLLIGAGIVTGYSISNDAASGNVKMDYHSLWGICIDKLETMQSELLSVNESKGIIKANISGYSVAIKIDSINSETQRLKVSARKYFMPKPQFAQKTFFHLLEDLGDLE